MQPIDVSQPALQAGQIVTLKIDDIAFGGEGVGRCRNFVVFVYFTIPGETVEAEITEVKKNFARAKLVRVLEPSESRTAPECRYFGSCGGCQYQHIRYERQLLIKRKQISDLLCRLGRFESLPVDPVIPCPRPYHYRNRIMIRSQWNKPERKLNIGFIRYDNRLVEDIESCEIAEPELSEEIKNVRLNPPPKGGIKIELRILPEDWDVPRHSFFQNNFHLLPAMIGKASEFIAEAGNPYLIDAYCGVGFFSLELAGNVKGFVGVEFDRRAIESARRNAERRKIGNGEFIAGNAEDWLPGLWDRFPADRTTLLLDPPRKGCAPEIVEMLREVRPRQIIYISCHPAMLARDLNSLCRDGVYTVKRVAPMDMFPQTQHIECLVDLRRSE